MIVFGVMVAVCCVMRPMDSLAEIALANNIVAVVMLLGVVMVEFFIVVSQLGN